MSVEWVVWCYMVPSLHPLSHLLPRPQVSRNFTEIFEELSPGGTGRLEMKMREMAVVST